MATKERLSKPRALIFYQRQICSHARGVCLSFDEFAKRLAYEFIALSPNTS